MSDIDNVALEAAKVAFYSAPANRSMEAAILAYENTMAEKAEYTEDGSPFEIAFQAFDLRRKFGKSFRYAIQQAILAYRSAMEGKLRPAEEVADSVLTPMPFNRSLHLALREVAIAAILEDRKERA